METKSFDVHAKRLEASLPSRLTASLRKVDPLVTREVTHHGSGKMPRV